MNEKRMIDMIYIAALIFVVGLLWFFFENYRSNHCLGVTRHDIVSGKIPEGFHNKKFVFLSDLHNNSFGKDNDKLFALLEKEAPDFILVGGDMLVSKRENAADVAIPFMEKLASQYPVYCANGNHEARLLWKEEEYPEAGEIYRTYIEHLKKAGICHLCDETATISMGKDQIYVSGLEPEQRSYKKLELEPMTAEEIASKIGTKKNDFHILLAHNPAYFETYAQWGADLTLSGHVHGGIMRLPILGGVIAPSYHLFPKYDAGAFSMGDQKMIVSVGLGSHSIKIRLFNPPKIDVITLKREGK